PPAADAPPGHRTRPEVEPGNPRTSRPGRTAAGHLPARRPADRPRARPTATRSPAPHAPRHLIYTPSIEAGARSGSYGVRRNPRYTRLTAAPRCGFPSI